MKKSIIVLLGIGMIGVVVMSIKCVGLFSPVRYFIVDSTGGMSEPVVCEFNYHIFK